MYYETAPLTVTVSPSSNRSPQVSFTGAIGSIYEMSPVGTLVKHSDDLSRAVRVIVTDADLVRDLL